MGFTVGDEIGVERVAERMGVEIRHYDIIYHLIEDVEQALHGMLDPTYTDVVMGRAEVRELFSSRRTAQIAGCRVTEGRMVRNANIRVMRDGAAIAEATIASLRHFREEVNEITNGMECGITLQGFNDIQEGDILEAYRQERSQR